MNPLEARRRLLGRNVYKRTTEGNPAIAQGSLARMYPGITMQGWTEQDSTTGAQLWDEANEAEYVNGRRYVFHCEPNTDYTFSTDVTVSSLGVLYGEFNNENVLAVKYNATELTFNSGEYDTLYMQVYNPENFGDIKVMLNAGSTVLPYELYTGGKPSPSPDYPQEIVSAGNYDEATGKYKYEVKLTGVNLFDISKVITNSGLLTNNGDGTLTVTLGSGDSAVGGKAPRTLRDYCPELIYGKTYYLSANTTGTTKQIYLLGANNVWGYGRSRTITDADLESEVFFYASGINSEAVISDIMITEVDGADYEPYHTPQTVTLTSDRPLTKWDRLEKRNGQWGWVYKSNIKSLPKTGFSIRKRINNNGVYYIKELPLSEYDARIENIGNHIQYFSLFANKNPYDNVGNYAWLYSVATNNVVQFRLGLQDDSIVSVQDLEEYLSELGEIIAVYETESETFALLSASEQEQMNALHTFRPTTVLSNDADCEMTLTYKTKKSLEVTE